MAQKAIQQKANLMIAVQKASYCPLARGHAEWRKIKGFR
jgi:hypothetical protein